MLDVPEGVKLVWVTESFRQFCALVSLANIFRWKIYKIKLYCQCDYIIQDAHKKTKKHTSAKAAVIRLTLLLFSMCTKQRARYQHRGQT